MHQLCTYLELYRRQELHPGDMLGRQQAAPRQSALLHSLDTSHTDPGASSPNARALGVPSSSRATARATGATMGTTPL